MASGPDEPERILAEAIPRRQLVSWLKLRNRHAIEFGRYGGSGLGPDHGLGIGEQNFKTLRPNRRP